MSFSLECIHRRHLGRLYTSLWSFTYCTKLFQHKIDVVSFVVVVVVVIVVVVVAVVVVMVLVPSLLC